MTSSGLASPPRAAPNRVHKTAPKPPEGPRRAERSPPSFERILAWSLGVSLFLHLLLLLVSPFVIQVEEPSGTAAPQPTSADQAFGLQMVVPIPSENAPENPATEDPPDEVPPVTRTQPPQLQTPTQSSGPGQTPPNDSPATPSGPSASEVIRPGFSDSRLYVTPDEFPELRKTEHERYMERLQARIDAVNDSMGVAAARDRRTSDWTYTDDSGKKWGLDPDGLHLGGFTVPRALLPLPAATGDNQTLEAERERLRMREEIQEQEARREREETTSDRVDAIRDRENQNRQNGGGS